MPDRRESGASPRGRASQPPSAGEHLAICDALLRFAEGVDGGEGDLISSAFAEEARIDFGPCGRMLGFDFPLLEGREAIVGFLAATAGAQITTHAVTNQRTSCAGKAATVTALVEATHIPRDGSARRLRMMNRYTADLVRVESLWRLHRMSIAGVWFEGDADVLLAR